MSDENGDPLIEPVHVVDASIVAGIVFFSLLLGTTLPELLSAGEVSYLTFSEVMDRALTALVAFFLTFFAQWARYRGIEAGWGNG